MEYLPTMNINKENKKSKEASKGLFHIISILLNNMLPIFIFLSSLSLFQKVLSYLNYLKVSHLFL